MRIAIIGAGSVGRALGDGLARHAHVVFGVRDPLDGSHDAIGSIATATDAVEGSEVTVLAVPASAVPDLVPSLGLRAGQILVDATNAVRSPVPGGHSSMGALVASLLPPGVELVKAFNTIGAEHLADGHLGDDRAFLPIAGDERGLSVIAPLAEALGFDPVAVGGREAFGLVEAHAALWIQLAFGCGWGRGFGFVVRGR